MEGTKTSPRVAPNVVEKTNTSEPAVEEHTINLKKFFKAEKKKKWKHKYGSESIQSNQREKNIREKLDPFPGNAPIPSERLKKYKRGQKIDTYGMKTKHHGHAFRRRERQYQLAVKQAARSENLLHEEPGFLEAGEGEETSQITQREISNAVDITSAAKYFELDLKQFGPYRMNYSRNGRHLLLGGRKGHLAAIDWQTKKLMCEINVMESIHDVKWLHIETMFAVAQKQWTYIYDNQGIELHCLKMLDQVQRLEFLPYHFLLASANAKGYLSYIDVSIGQKVAGFQTHLGRLSVMCQNPSNAIIHLGDSKGTVSLWSPNIKEPLVKMLCHGSAVKSVTVDNKGQYMATSGVDRYLKIWDLRTYKQLQCYRIASGASNLAFSQRECIAAGIGNVVEVYHDCCTSTMTAPYMTHKLRSSVSGVQFCPYEDVLGVTHGEGFASLLIPGAGEANFDALEANPYQTKKQRRHAEVKMLLEKIQPEMISLDTSALGKVDSKTYVEKIEEKNKLLFIKPQKVEFEPKYKMKGKSKGRKLEQRKKGVQGEARREFIKEAVGRKTEEENAKSIKTKPKTVLDRFKKTSKD